MGTQTAWLIERGQAEGQNPTVWMTDALPYTNTYGGWTTNANEAQHFPTREAAEIYIETFFPARNARATEHIWSAMPDATEREFLEGLRYEDKYPAEERAEAHDDKGFSEEKCVRCGWVMGQPPLNCQNDDTPHVFPSAESERAELAREVERDA